MMNMHMFSDHNIRVLQIRRLDGYRRRQNRERTVEVVSVYIENGEKNMVEKIETSK